MSIQARRVPAIGAAGFFDWIGAVLFMILVCTTSPWLCPVK